MAATSLERLGEAASSRLSRRSFLRAAGAAGAMAGLQALLPDYARTLPIGHTPRALYPRMVDGLAVYDLEIAETPIEIAGRRATATTINGTVPGPLLHLYEGQEVASQRFGQSTLRRHLNDVYFCRRSDWSWMLAGASPSALAA